MNATGVFARLALLFIPIASFSQSGVHLQISDAHLDSALMPESDEQFYPVGVVLLADSPRNLSICREQKRRPMRTTFRRAVRQQSRIGSLGKLTR